jgi:hypothetical protein
MKILLFVLLASAYSWFVHQSSLAIIPGESSTSEAGGTGEGNYEFLPYEVSFSYFECFFLTFRKIFRHGADGLTSPPKESVVRIFIALGRV